MNYTKAITAFLTSAVTAFAALGLDLAFLSPELIASIGTVVGAFLVWALPNKGN